MSGINIKRSEARGIWIHAIRNQEFITELESSYYSLLMSNYGPKNYLTIVQNSAGNNFLTSSSKILLQQLSFYHPCFKFINAFIAAQNKAYGTHGLYVGALCSGLLFKSLKLEELIPHRITTEITEWIQHTLLKKILLDTNKKICCSLDIGKLDEVLCIVKSVVRSKSYHTLSKKENDHISAKIVEAFLFTIPNDVRREFGLVNISTVDGSSILDSRIINGILHREPEFTLEELQLRLKKILGEKIKIIIFVVPLSHDVEERDLIEWNSNLSLEYSLMDHYAKNLIKVLKENEIKVIANQKYIHEALKYDLEKENILVLERLGTTCTESLVDMTGCCTINSLSEIDEGIEDYIGYISSVQAITIGEKLYINVLPVNPHQTLTFVLTGGDCSVMEYLKESIDSCISLLQRMICDAKVVAGAGCLEAYIAYSLSHTKQLYTAHLAKMFDASASSIYMVFDVYIRTFMQLAVAPTGGKSGKPLDYVVDSIFYHLWPTDGNSTNKADIVQSHCTCKCICKEDLPPSARFIPLLDLKTRDFISDLKPALNTDKSVEIEALDESLRSQLSVAQGPSFKLIKDGIVDNFSAKVNAIQFAFSSFSELLKIGICIFDKQ